MKKSILFFFALFYLSVNLIAGTSKYVILISFDGFRWDYLNRGISPNLEKLRNEGISTLSLRPAFPTKTFPNHISLITGMYVENHGIISNHFHDCCHNLTYSMADTNSIRESRWYLGEAFWETAERNGIKTASYFWPGSELRLDYRRPSYYYKYDHNRHYEKKINGIIEWLKLPIEKRPHFITLYFHETDTYAHDYGVNSDEVNSAIKHLDSVTGFLVSELEKINMKDSVNIIIVSDHGMTDISIDRIINIESMIEDYDCKFADDGPYLQVMPNEDKIKDVYNILKKNENNYRVYLKEEMPGYYHYNKHPYIYPIIVIADIGWSVSTNRRSSWLGRARANHGYDRNHIDMHGIFIANGPSFKSNYKTGTLWNIDLYPLLCKIFQIQPRSNVDGNIERIGFILK